MYSNHINLEVFPGPTPIQLLPPPKKRRRKENTKSNLCCSYTPLEHGQIALIFFTCFVVFLLMLTNTLRILEYILFLHLDFFYVSLVNIILDSETSLLKFQLLSTAFFTTHGKLSIHIAD